MMPSSCSDILLRMSFLCVTQTAVSLYGSPVSHICFYTGLICRCVSFYSLLDAASKDAPVFSHIHKVNVHQVPVPSVSSLTHLPTYLLSSMVLPIYCHQWSYPSTAINGLTHLLPLIVLPIYHNRRSC